MKNHVIEKFDLSGDTAVSVKELNLYYGNFHAEKHLSRFSEKQADGSHRSFGMR